MAFPVINYASPELMQSPVNDIINNLFSGFTKAKQAQYLEPNLAESLKKAQLYNQYYGPNIESQIGLRGAQAGHLGAMTQGLNISNPFLRKKLEQEEQQRAFNLENPLLGHTGAAGQIADLMYLNKHPELMQNANMIAPQNGQTLGQGQGQGQGQGMFPIQQQPSYEDLLRQSIVKNISQTQKPSALSPTGKLESERNDVITGHFPGTTTPIPSDERLPLLRAYDEKLGRVKAGERYIYNETNKPIGMERPYSESEKKVHVGRAMFNELLPVVNEGMKGFTAKGSITNLNKYANHYGKDKEATKKIDDFFLALETFPATVVNEQQTLGAGKTNLTFRKLAETIPYTDIQPFIKNLQKSYNLPDEVIYKAANRYQQLINQATHKAETSLPAFKKTYFDKEKSKKVSKLLNKENDPLGIR